MAKLVQVLRDLATSVGIKAHADFEAVLGASGLKEFDIPDDVATKLASDLYTKDRALADPDITKTARMAAKSIFMDSIDEEIKPLLPKFSEETQKKIVAEKDTVKKMKLIQTAIDEVSAATGGTKDSEKARKEEKELRDKITSLEASLSTKDKEYNEKIEKFELTTVLKSKIFGTDIAKPLHSIKDTIANGVIDKLAEKYVLKLNKTKTDVDIFRDVEGTLKDVYEDNNKKVTFALALEREMEPYTSKNNNGKETGGTGGGQGGTVIKQKTGKTSSMTLEDARLQQASNAA